MGEDVSYYYSAAMPENEPDNSKPTRLQTVASWLVLIGACAFGAVFIYGAIVNIHGANGAWLLDIAQQHFAATIGLPFAALAALCLVYFLEIKAGPIEFDGFGFKFRGAAGPVIFWVIVFLAIASAIKLLWNAK